MTLQVSTQIPVCRYGDFISTKFLTVPFSPFGQLGFKSRRGGASQTLEAYPHLSVEFEDRPTLLEIASSSTIKVQTVTQLGSQRCVG